MTNGSSQQRGNRMGFMPVPKLVVSMAIPLMLSLLVQSLYNIVDSVFVSRISEDALAATTLAYPVQMLMVALSVGISVGINAYLSRLLGQGKAREVGFGATTGMILAVVSMVLFIVFRLFFLDVTVSLLTEDENIRLMVRQYLGICTLWCGGIFIETMAQRFLQASGKTHLSMFSLVAGAVTNIVLDPVLIFGLLGFPAMGITGAAVATVIGQWVGAVVALLINRRRNPEVRMIFKGYRWEWKVAGAIFKVGLPTIVTQALGSVMNFSMNAILLSWSTTAVAFFGAYYRLQNFLMMPMNGLGQAAIPIVGFNYGAAKPERIRDTIRVSLISSVCIAFLFAVVFIVIPKPLLSLFNASETMLEIGIPAIRIIAPTFVFAAVTIILGYCGSGLGSGMVNMTGTGIRYVVVLVPVSYALLNISGISSVWWSFWVAEVCAACAAVLLFLHLYRKRMKF